MMNKISSIHCWPHDREVWFTRRATDSFPGRQYRNVSIASFERLRNVLNHFSGRGLTGNVLLGIPDNSDWNIFMAYSYYKR